MEIRPLDKATYAGKKFTARYRTKGYYDICASEDGFRIRYVPFPAIVEKSFEDAFFAEWLENSVAFGAFEGGNLLGFAEGAPESWNNRFRLSNICVFEPSERGRGIGSALMECLTKTAISLGTRMMILETQSCNENAIAFYKKNDFDIVGFDLYSYSNTDPERHEVRVEMGKKLIEQKR